MFFQKHAGVCGKLGKSYICRKCEIQLQPQYHAKKFLNTHPFQKHIYLFSYKGKIRNLLLSYKFKQKSYLYLTFSEILIKNKKIYKNLKNCDIILPVPISKQRKKERGYNQSALIARKIANQVGVFYKANVLIKVKNNPKQSALSKSERAKNVKNAYKIADIETIHNKKVMLVDDIYTTGNTASECARILKQAGAKMVNVLTIAKD